MAQLWEGGGGIILAQAGSWSVLMTLGAHCCINQGLFPENGSPEAVAHWVPSKMSHGGWCGAWHKEKQKMSRSGAALSTCLISRWLASLLFLFSNREKQLSASS